MATFIKCVLCDSTNLQKVVDLGSIYHSAFIDKPLTKGKPHEVYGKPLPTSLYQCQDCDHVRMGEFQPPDVMFREYFYRSGTNPMMIKELSDVGFSSEKFLAASLNKKSHAPRKVLDIGCNDHTLLKGYDGQVTFRVGVDPANYLKELNTSGLSDLFVNDYFDLETHPEIKSAGPYEIIFSIAMFYDLPNPNKFVKELKECLSPQGVWCCQMTDLASTLRINAFDNIGFEHICYYTLKVFKKLVEKHGLQLSHVEYNGTNGGSFRAFVQHDDQNHPVRESVDLCLKLEEDVLSVKSWGQFFNTSVSYAQRVRQLIFDLNRRGKKVFAYGASTKGNTYLQFTGLTEKELPYCLEVSPFKYGKYTLGSNLYIVSEDQGFGLRPDYLLVLPWHFKEEIIKKHKDWLSNGGTFIFPLPVPHLYNIQGETWL